MSTTIYGASDDLIEIEGDLEEEWNAYDFNGKLALSNGVLFSMKYNSQGIWRINILAGHDKVTHLPAQEGDENRDENGYPTYSDRIIIDEPVKWAAIVKKVVGV